MSIQRAEQLKRELTDKFVVVVDGAPELRRFSGLTGQVKTVNMSCRALVQFDGPADIGWYDIDTAYLKLVNAPAPKKAAAHPAPAKTPGEVQGSAPKPVGKSPLELARAQAAQKTGATAKPAAAPAAGEKKLSPLELARQQGAQKSGAAPAAVEKPAPAPAPATAASGKKLSPLELARQQGAVKAGGATPPTATPAPKPAPAPAPESPQPAAPAPKAAAAPAPAATKVDASKMSTAEILAACRQQGAFKG